MKTTFNGLPIQGFVPKFAPGQPEFEQLTWAISMWRKCATSGEYSSATCENAARELEIERDSGYIVHINKRV